MGGGWRTCQLFDSAAFQHLREPAQGERQTSLRRRDRRRHAEQRDDYDHADDLEEERRLCYVAMTRAKEALYISHARSRMLYGRSSYNRRSRFVEEIPISCVAASERSPQLGQRASQTAGGYASRPRQSESAVGSFTGYSGAGSYSRCEKPAAPAAPAARSGSTAKAQLESQTLPDLKQGDMVSHRAFGSGMVLSVQPMGGDALLEIAFDGVGNKRLMAKSAAKFLTKL